MMLKLLRSLLAAALLLLPLAATAVGHSELEVSDPADGATITTPYKLTATFTEEFDPNPQRSFINVVDAAENEVARGQVSVDDPLAMTVDIPALAPGEYTVRWQTTTGDDSGVERDTFKFTVVAAAPSASASATASVTSQPSARPTPEEGGSPGQSTGSNNDLVLALVVAAIAIGAVAIFVFTRMRRT